MIRNTSYFLFGILLIAVFATLLGAQNNDPGKSFSYEAQKNFIPKELGKVYLGMPFDKFAGAIDLKKAEVGDTRFDWLQLSLPIAKGNVQMITVKIHGLSQEEKDAILFDEKAMKKDGLGNEYEGAITRISTEKITGKGFVYAMYIDFKREFDLKSYVLKTYGKDGEVRKADDPYYFFDIQWVKKTPDGLAWLIRSFHEGDKRSLQLLGRIENTEWGLDN